MTARDPKRIPEVLKAIQEAWELAPDLRLGQLISNMTESDVFYIEDECLVKQLDKFKGDCIVRRLKEKG